MFVCNELLGKVPVPYPVADILPGICNVSSSLSLPHLKSSTKVLLISHFERGHCIQRMLGKSVCMLEGIPFERIECVQCSVDGNT